MQLNFFQEGGAMVPAGGAPQDPMAQLINMATQAVQANDPNLAMQVCQVLVQIAQQAGPQGPPPDNSEPADGEPVYRRGGRLLGRFRR